MTENHSDLTLSEAERIECNRRVDVGLAVALSASKLFCERTELNDSIKSKSKQSGSYWYSIVGAGGVAIHFLLAGNEFKFNAGTFIAMMTILYWYINVLELEKLRGRQSGLMTQLSDLELQWRSAMGDGDGFWSIGEFELGFQIDWEDDAFSEWWAKQTDQILMRVCEIDKAHAISSYRSEQRQLMKTVQKSMNGSYGGAG